MKDIIRIEFQKIVRRKDCLLMFSMIFIPILYSIGLAMNSKAITYVGKNKVYALSFISEMYSFVYMCFIYFIILSVCVVRSLKGEIENKSIQLYTQRINNRKKIYLAKNMAYLLMTVANTFIFIIISCICFYLFLTKRTDIAIPILFQQGEVLYCVLNLAAILLCFIFTVNISMFLSSYLKSFGAMGAFIFIWLLFMYLKEFPIIKYVVPIYYVEKIVNSDVVKLEWKSFLVLLILVLIYSLISMFLGWKKFEKSDL